MRIALSSRTAGRLLAAFCAISMSALPCRPQSAQPQATPLMHFDIFTVKPNKTGGGGMSVSWHDNVFAATNVNLKFLVQLAYNIRQPLIENLPKWGESAHWDVQGKISDFDPALDKKMTIEQKRAMQRELLEHTFGLRVHNDTKEQLVYEMVIAKTGLKMTENTVDPNALDAKGKTGMMLMNDDRLDAQGATMENITKALEGVVDRTIVDKTGLTGKYDVKLRWLPETSSVKPDDDALPGIFAALQEQLGLKLQPAKGNVNVLVVDAAQLPEEN